MLLTHAEVQLFTQTEPEWLVHGLIAKGERVVLYGEPGMHKSWLLAHLATSVICGKPWLDHYHTDPGGPVLYLDEEMAPRLTVGRWQRLLPAEPLHPYLLTCLESCRINAEGVSRLEGWMATMPTKPILVCIDAFRRVLVGDENKQQDITLFWRRLTDLCMAHGIAVVVVHHSRKPQEYDESLRHVASGSYEMMAACDLAFVVTANGPLITLACQKAREIEIPDPLQVMFHEDAATKRVSFSYQPDLPNHRSQAATAARTLLTQVGPSVVLTRSQITQAIQTTHPLLTYNDIGNGLDYLVSNGQAVRVGPSQYRLAPDGGTK